MTVEEGIKNSLSEAGIDGVITGFIVVASIISSGSEEHTVMLSSDGMSMIQSMGLAQAAVHISNSSFNTYPGGDEEDE